MDGTKRLFEQKNISKKKKNSFSLSHFSEIVV